MFSPRTTALGRRLPCVGAHFPSCRWLGGTGISTSAGPGDGVGGVVPSSPTNGVSPVAADAAIDATAVGGAAGAGDGEDPKWELLMAAAVGAVPPPPLVAGGDGAHHPPDILSAWQRLRSAGRCHAAVLTAAGVGVDVDERERIRVNARRVGLQVRLLVRAWVEDGELRG